MLYASIVVMLLYSMHTCVCVYAYLCVKNSERERNTALHACRNYSKSYMCVHADTPSPNVKTKFMTSVPRKNGTTLDENGTEKCKCLMVSVCDR